MSDNPPGPPPPGHPPSWSGGGQPGSGYPQQHLLPQEVHRGVNRKPVYVVVAAVLALVVVGAVVFVLMRDDGEDNRAAYCAELRDLTNNGDLGSALSGADESTVDRIRQLQDTAPTTVADDWKKIIDTADSTIASQTPDPSELLSAFGALRAISNDAKQNCGLDLQLI